MISLASITRLSTLAGVLWIIGSLVPVYAWLDPGSLEAAVAGQPMERIHLGERTDRLILKLRQSQQAIQAGGVSGIAARLAALSGHLGIDLTYSHAISDGAMVVRIPERFSLSRIVEIAKQLADRPDVLYAEPDVRMFPQRVPNDPRFLEQWHYFEDTGGIRLPEAWDITTDSSNITVAVIDTGIVSHADLSANVVQGYDFISDPATANDGDGRDADPSDPGDWVTTIESNSPGPFEDCPATDSSWHGTHVSGTIGAVTNNGLGVAGVNWSVKLQPVRVLGKCGGFLSDIVDGMRWAAGLSVPNVPNNPTPANVLNLSLGGEGACSFTTLETAINDIIGLGKTVVVAAGNQGRNVFNTVPASCAGTVPVAATTREGSKAPYSNFGPLVAISAPGGRLFFGPDDPNGILSTANTGTTVPAEDTYRFFQGTSMAAAHVSGAVALMLSVDPNLDRSEIIQKLMDTARPFPDISCNTFTCGAGIVNANAAVRTVLPSPPPMVEAGPDQTVDPGVQVSLSGSVDDDGEIVRVEWTQTAGEPVELIDQNTLALRFQAPLAAGELMFQLTATDNFGLQGQDTVEISINNLPPVIDSIEDKAVFIGETLDFTITATDPNGITPLLSATGLPESTIFDTSTGQFNWPDAGPVGDYQVTFTAIDAQSDTLTDSETVLITVLERTGGSDTGGGGCTVGRPGIHDPVLPGLVLLALLYFAGRRDRYKV